MKKRQFGIFYKDDSFSTTPIETGTEGEIANLWKHYGIRQLELKIRPLDDIFGNRDEWMLAYNSNTGKPLNQLVCIGY
ncbi:MAG: hypothetical protein HOG03_24100 [Desulfobacula sp.]|jgi:hypothetical protein|uniref:hypothetical protein n=1 Tax=Desulfobacula sp. TaxID=2593537 RepID=UPI001DA0CD10|nr:hypothetical protein [Desulfobacula sp.]MBT6338804.1 hypothetical protein [Desulfobacula sp.]MBT7631288.1 hypothetical protein [Desulfobacula sp.]